MVSMRGGIDVLGVGGFLKEVIVKYDPDFYLEAYGNSVMSVLLCAIGTRTGRLLR